MCGIIGILGNSPASIRIAEGLKRLEYRGYDSSGVATLVGGQIDRRRAEGKLINLINLLAQSPLEGNTGIGHIRWATHGAPVVRNAHPHATDKVAIVHNGIIENFRELRTSLEKKGHVFITETDSEVIANLATEKLTHAPNDPVQAVSATLKELQGAFALAFLFQGRDDLLIGARHGSPLVVGIGESEYYLGSDAMALAPFTNKIVYLEEGDWCILEKGKDIQFFDAKDNVVQRPVKVVNLSSVIAEKGEHRHFMAKEIFEQPTVIAQTISSYLDGASESIVLPELPFDWDHLTRVSILGCGTAFYAGMVAKYWFEGLARLPVEVDIASEFRYRQPPLPNPGLTLLVSQSGETADTLAGLRYARSQGQYIAGVVNVPESSMVRESDAWLPTHAGPEIGVASTKAFTCQLSALAMIALASAVGRGFVTHQQMRHYSRLMLEVPRHINEALAVDKDIAVIAHDLSKARDVLYLGRGALYPVAMEGALKLKEISYIHAEGYAAGEMKHGPIALIDEDVPVIVIAPSDELFEKTISNMHEVKARGGKVILVSDKKGLELAGDGVWHTIEMPEVDPFIAPIVYAIPMQLLAYHTAVHKGTDVDQPRNLAKSVTVE